MPEFLLHGAPGSLQRRQWENATGAFEGLSMAPVRFPDNPRKKSSLQPMPVSKYRAHSTCLSCNRRISGPAGAAVTTVREDAHQPRAYLVHEGCQSAMLLDLPFDDEPEPATRKA